MTREPGQPGEQPPAERGLLDADAVADFSRDHHEQAPTWTAQRCGVVTSTAQALEAATSIPATAADAPA